MKRWFLTLWLCLIASCSTPPQPPNGAPGQAQISLFIHATLQLSGPAATPLVIPGASWLEADLGALTGPQPVVFYDMRGRGRSAVVESSAHMSLEFDVADLESVRDRLGLEKIDLLGWAYGAQVCVRYALAHPSRVGRLVLVGPLPPAFEGYWKAYVENYGRRFSPGARHSIQALAFSGAKAKNPELYCRRIQEASMRAFVYRTNSLEHMRATPWVLPNLDPERNAQHVQAILTQMGPWNWIDDLRQLKQPVLVIHGEEELLPLASSQAYVDALPDAQLLLIPDAGHMPWLEQPGDFFPAVRSFLRGASAPQDSAQPSR